MQGSPKSEQSNSLRGLLRFHVPAEGNVFHSDGADIDQSFAQTEGFVIAICAGENGNFELYDFTGHQRGWKY